MFISWKFELLFKQLGICRFRTGNVIQWEEGRRKWQEGKLGVRWYRAWNWEEKLCFGEWRGEVFLQD